MVRDRLAASPFAAEPRGRVILTGGASQLTGLPELAARIFSAGRCASAGRSASAGLPEAAKGPAFAVATGLLVYPQVAHLEHFEPRRTRHSMTGTAAISPASDGGFERVSDGDRASKPCTPVADWHAHGRGDGREGRCNARAIEEAAMTINLKIPDIRELKPRITVFGVGGAGGNAVNNMITSGPSGLSTSSSPTPTRRRSPCRRPSASSRWACR